MQEVQRKEKEIQQSNVISGEDFWVVSWQIIDSFCPSIKSDVLMKIKPSSPLSISPPVSPSLPPANLPIQPLSSTAPSTPASPPYPYFIPIHLPPVPSPPIPLTASPSSSPSLLASSPPPMDALDLEVATFVPLFPKFVANIQ